MSKSLIAVDIGNSFLHVARYSMDERTSQLALAPWGAAPVAEVLRGAAVESAWFEALSTAPTAWFVASVNRQRESQLADRVRQLRPDDSYHLLSSADFALTMDVDAPQRVGTDRVAAALAAFALRRQTGSAIVVDAGTALTVDRVDPPGVFRGGAIFPGTYLLAESLHRHTDALPLVPPMSSAPEPIGRNTEAAIRSGLFWGTVGAIRELIAQLQADLANAPELFFTGGAQLQLVAQWFDASYVPDLVLRGVALAGARQLNATPRSSAIERA